ncbi:MAG: PqqD family protein [Acidobacteriota bacterium]
MRPQARVDLKSVDLESELLIYDERRRLVHLLNSTARRIWQMCDGTHRVDEITSEVTRLFPEQPLSQVQSDVEQALSSMESQDIIVWVSEEVGNQASSER